MMNWLLISMPVAICLEVFAPDRYLLIFSTSCLAILPLARWMGRASPAPHQSKCPLWANIGHARLLAARPA